MKKGIKAGSDGNGREGRKECRERPKQGKMTGSDGKGREGQEGRQTGCKGLRQVRGKQEG